MTGGRSWSVATRAPFASIDVRLRRMTERDSRFRIGELRRQVKLTTEAIYRVLEVDPEQGLVVVEVVVAPGLAPGRVLRFTSNAVAEMAVIPESGTPEGP